MRFFAFFLLLLAVVVPASAQPPAGTLDTLRRDFPLDHQALAASLEGKTPQEARRLAYAGIERFLHSRRAAILAAPAPSLLDLESRQGALLRALAKQDPRLCAKVGDRGFFSGEALAGAAPPGLDEYGTALIEAAKAGSTSRPAAPAGTGKEDFDAWMAAVAKIEPEVPVRSMLLDRNVRLASSPDHLCRGAAAMHEAVALLPAARAERLSRTLVGSVIGAPAP